MSESNGEYGDYSVDDDDQLNSEDSLEGDTDPLDGDGYETADGYSPDYGDTALEEEQGETLDQRLAQEVPDRDPRDPDAIDRSEARPGASAEEEAMHVEDEE